MNRGRPHFLADGDAARVAKDVEAALHEVIAKEGGKLRCAKILDQEGRE